MRRIDPLDVAGRIGFGVAEPLCIGKCSRVGRAARHLIEDEVGRAVEDAAHFEHLFAGQRFAQRAHDRNRSADRGFVMQRNAALRGARGETRALRREQIFVRRNDVLAGVDRLRDEIARDPRSADALDDQPDVVAPHQRRRVGREERRTRDAGTRLVRVAHGDRAQHEIRAARTGDRACVGGQQMGDAAADRAASQESDSDGHVGLSVAKRARGVKAGIGERRRT